MERILTKKMEKNVLYVPKTLEKNKKNLKKFEEKTAKKFIKIAKQWKNKKMQRRWKKASKGCEKSTKI